MVGLGDFTFHDLRHCSTNNLRLTGNDQFVIKKVSGHKTDSDFKRYNQINPQHLFDSVKTLEKQLKVR